MNQRTMLDCRSYELLLHLRIFLLELSASLFPSANIGWYPDSASDTDEETVQECRGGASKEYWTEG